MKTNNILFIELDFINDLEKETSYKALINVNNIVSIWVNDYGFTDIRVAATDYLGEHSTLNTLEEIKEMIMKGGEHG